MSFLEEQAEEFATAFNEGWLEAESLDRPTTGQIRYDPSLSGYISIYDGSAWISLESHADQKSKTPLR